MNEFKRARVSAILETQNSSVTIQFATGSIPYDRLGEKLAEHINKEMSELVPVPEKDDSEIKAANAKVESMAKEIESLRAEIEKQNAAKMEVQEAPMMKRRGRPAKAIEDADI